MEQEHGVCEQRSDKIASASIIQPSQDQDCNESASRNLAAGQIEL